MYVGVANQFVLNMGLKILCSINGMAVFNQLSIC